MEKKFVKLHCHSTYSMRDGLLKISDIVQKAIKDNEIPCITDHGSIAGVIEFIDECNKNDIIGAVGCEFYFNKNIKRLLELKQLIEEIKDKEKKKNFQLERDSKKKNNHLVLIAKNTHGFYNIVELNNKAYINGFYNKPIIDYDDLFAMQKDKNGDYGVIVTSACFAGSAPKYILNNDMQSAIEWCRMMQAKFEDDFYLEVQTNGLPEQITINKGLIEISKKLNIQLCVGIDAHYLESTWLDTHQDLLLLQGKNTRTDLNKFDYKVTWENRKGEIKTKKIPEGKDFRKGVLVDDIKVGDVFGKGKNLDKIMKVEKDSRAWAFTSDQLWYKAEKDIVKDSKTIHIELKNDIKAIIQGNYDIGSKLSKIEIEKNIKLPRTEHGYETLMARVKVGLKNKIQEGEVKKEEIQIYVDRIKYEMDVIRKNGFEDYFLILADVLDYVKEQDIAMGAGRGSAAGSMVAYLLGIHRINPIDPRFPNLTFERFLNEERLNNTSVTITSQDGESLSLISHRKITIVRNKKQMIIRALELQENDEIIQFNLEY